MPRVSVIIPTYNRSVLVRRAIESVLSQTFRDFELLVIDDRGDLKTQSVIEDIIKKDPRVRYIPNETRLGLMENKNKGVRLSESSSEYVAFLDDDDVYLPNFLERTISELDKNLEAVAACTDCELRHQDGTFVKRYFCEKKVFWRVSLGGGSVLRKYVFTKFNIWFDKNAIFEDLDFGIRVVKDHLWMGIPEVLRTYYRYYSKMGDSMSTMYTKTTPLEVLEYFLKKNETIYATAGNRALAWAHSLTGKMLVRAGHKRAGMKHLLFAFKKDPKISYLLYYFIAFVFPSAFSKQSFAVWKNIILGKLKKQ